MKYRYFFVVSIVSIISFAISGCQISGVEVLKSNPLPALSTKTITNFLPDFNTTSESKDYTKPLGEILNNALIDNNDGKDFVTAVGSALEKDPAIISQKQVLAAKLAAIDTSEAKKDYRITSTLYGGVEDITDNTKGVALGVNASRLIFDGGLLDAQVESKNFEAEAAKLNLRATIDERAYNLGEIWLELEKYQTLQSQIDKRLAVLDPLIGQLERIAQAGLGDVSKVTAAQRTVSAIRVTETSISEGLAKAQLEFLNAFGKVDKNISYDQMFIEKLLPDEITEGSAQKSPLLLAKYASYRAALANLRSVKSSDDFNVGFEAKALRPFAGSGYDSDESIGLVARKTLFNGGMLESEIIEAEAMAEAALAEVEVAYRKGVRMVSAAQQTIVSMNKAIGLARDNAKVTADEIIYLRQQLIIGGSTLDSVLSAEARLYEAESKEIKFLADKRKAELLIVSTLGLLGTALSVN